MNHPRFCLRDSVHLSYWFMPVVLFCSVNHTYSFTWTREWISVTRFEFWLKILSFAWNESYFSVVSFRYYENASEATWNASSASQWTMKWLRFSEVKLIFINFSGLFALACMVILFRTISFLMLILPQDLEAYWQEYLNHKFVWLIVIFYAHLNDYHASLITKQYYVR